MVEPSPTRKEQNQEATHTVQPNPGQLARLRVNPNAATDETATDMRQLAQNQTASQQTMAIRQ